MKKPNNKIVHVERKDTPNYKGYYQVSNFGEVKSLKRYVGGCGGCKRLLPERILKYRCDSNGYGMVRLWKKGKGKNARISRLIAKVFIPRVEGKPEINHKDGNKRNNQVSNLEWCTRSENVQHAYDTGLRSAPKTAGLKGEKSFCSKLKQWQVDWMRLLKKVEPDLPYHKIADMFDISAGHAHRIINHKRWI